MFLEPSDILTMAISEADLTPLQAAMVSYFFPQGDVEPARDKRGYARNPSSSGFVEAHPEYRLPGKKGKGRQYLREPKHADVMAELNAALQKIRVRMNAHKFEAVGDVIATDAAPSGKRTLANRG
jgi:hypothetical protein